MISPVVRKSHTLYPTWWMCRYALYRCVCAMQHNFHQWNQNQLCDLFNFILLIDTLSQLHEIYLLLSRLRFGVYARTNCYAKSRHRHTHTQVSVTIRSKNAFVVFRCGFCKTFGSMSIYIWCARALSQNNSEILSGDCAPALAPFCIERKSWKTIC